MYYVEPLSKAMVGQKQNIFLPNDDELMVQKVKRLPYVGGVFPLPIWNRFARQIGSCHATPSFGVKINIMSDRHPTL